MRYSISLCVIVCRHRCYLALLSFFAHIIHICSMRCISRRCVSYTSTLFFFCDSVRVNKQAIASEQTNTWTYTNIHILNEKQNFEYMKWIHRGSSDLRPQYVYCIYISLCVWHLNDWVSERETNKDVCIFFCIFKFISWAAAQNNNSNNKNQQRKRKRRKKREKQQQKQRKSWRIRKN